MKRALAVIFFILIAALASQEVSFNRIIYPIKTVDDSGYTLKQEQAPMRIISADPAVTELLFAYNLKDRIVGVTGNCDYPNDAKKIEKVGGDKLDMKKVLKLQPDLVIVPLETYKDDLEKMRAITFPVTISGEVKQVTLEVFAVDPKTLSDVVRGFYTIGTVTNREHAAYSLVQKFNRRIEWVAAKARGDRKFLKMRTLVLVSKRPMIAAGEKTYLHDLVVRAGLIDVAPREALGSKLSKKQIELADPDLVIASSAIARSAKDLYGNRNFRKTNAGKEKRAIAIDRSIFSRKGPRLADFIEELGEYAYGWRITGEAENK